MFWLIPKCWKVWNQLQSPDGGENKFSPFKKYTWGFSCWDFHMEKMLVFWHVPLSLGSLRCIITVTGKWLYFIGKKIKYLGSSAWYLSLYMMSGADWSESNECCWGQYVVADNMIKSSWNTSSQIYLFILTVEFNEISNCDVIATVTYLACLILYFYYNSPFLNRTVKTYLFSLSISVRGFKFWSFLQWLTFKSEQDIIVYISFLWWTLKPQ